jgi:hypothetical protein
MELIEGDDPAELRKRTSGHFRLMALLIDAAADVDYLHDLSPPMTHRISNPRPK